MLLPVLVPLMVPILIIVPRLIVVVWVLLSILNLKVFPIGFQNNSGIFVSVVVVGHNKYFLFLVLFMSFLFEAKASD